MDQKLLVGVGLTVLVAGSAALWLRNDFDTVLDRIDSGLQKSSGMSGARTDLPPEVLALAVRLGASGAAGGFATFKQTGQMWSKPSAKPMDFNAHQNVRAVAVGFLWRAHFGLPVPMVVADCFHAGTGGLEARILGAVRVMRGVGPAFDQGEALRYLAEVPVNPDAILANRSLDWRVIDARTISVAAGQAEACGVVTFDLDDSGLNIGMRAPLRMTIENGIAVGRPWKGRFWDYQRMGGRLLTLQAKVDWVCEAGDFIYWRGTMQN